MPQQDDGISWISVISVPSAITVILSLSSPLLLSLALYFTLLPFASLSSSLLHAPALSFSLLTPAALRTYTLRLVTTA